MDRASFFLKPVRCVDGSHRSIRVGRQGTSRGGEQGSGTPGRRWPAGGLIGCAGRTREVGEAGSCAPRLSCGPGGFGSRYPKNLRPLQGGGWEPGWGGWRGAVKPCPPSSAPLGGPFYSSREATGGEVRSGEASWMLRGSWWRGTRLGARLRLHGDTGRVVRSWSHRTSGLFGEGWLSGRGWPKLRTGVVRESTQNRISA